MSGWLILGIYLCWVSIGFISWWIRPLNGLLHGKLSDLNDESEFLGFMFFVVIIFIWPVYPMFYWVGKGFSTLSRKLTE